jgi:hypothetical protein
LSNLNYRELLLKQKNFFYGNKIFMSEIFCYHKKIFSAFFEILKISDG